MEREGNERKRRKRRTRRRDVNGGRAVVEVLHYGA